MSQKFNFSNIYARIRLSLMKIYETACKKDRDNMKFALTRYPLLLTCIFHPLHIYFAFFILRNF